MLTCSSSQKHRRAPGGKEWRLVDMLPGRGGKDSSSWAPRLQEEVQGRVEEGQGGLQAPGFLEHEEALMRRGRSVMPRGPGTQMYPQLPPSLSTAPHPHPPITLFPSEGFLGPGSRTS